MNSSLFLTLLPPEIRIQIYTLILPRHLRLKLRQHIPGLLDLSLLRLNRQIYTEALPVLYDSNTIIITRNDFCKIVSPGLKTPIRLDQARHLDVVTFNRSIPCALDSELARCDVCQVHALGMVRTFLAMPRLKTVVMRCGRVGELVAALRELLEDDEGLDVVMSVMGGRSYYLCGPGTRGKEILFVDR